MAIMEFLESYIMKQVRLVHFHYFSAPQPITNISSIPTQSIDLPLFLNFTPFAVSDDMILIGCNQKSKSRDQIYGLVRLADDEVPVRIVTTGNGPCPLKVHDLLWLDTECREFAVLTCNHSILDDDYYIEIYTISGLLF